MLAGRTGRRLPALSRRPCLQLPCLHLSVDKKKSGPAAPPCYRGAATRVRSCFITIRSFVQERKSGARRAPASPRITPPAAPFSPAVVVDRHGRQVLHLLPGDAEPDAVLDPCDRADLDGHFPAAPQVPFLEDHVGPGRRYRCPAGPGGGMPPPGERMRPCQLPAPDGTPVSPPRGGRQLADPF
jgi:hypothetical protein